MSSFHQIVAAWLPLLVSLTSPVTVAAEVIPPPSVPPPRLEEKGSEVGKPFRCPGNHRTIVIAVGEVHADESDTDKGRWLPLQNYVNDFLCKYNPQLQIAFRPMPSDQVLVEIKRKEDAGRFVDAALLPPYRYVDARMELGKDLVPIVRLRRPAPAHGVSPAQAPSQEGQSSSNAASWVLSHPPRSHYRSLIVMRAGTADYPPHDESPLRFRAVRQSTSALIYPLAIFRERGFGVRLAGNPGNSAEHGNGKLELELTRQETPGEFCYGGGLQTASDDSDRGSATTEVEEFCGRGGYAHLLAIDDERWAKSDKAARRKCRVVEESEPIPFDALAAVSMKPVDREQLRLAFSSTGSQPSGWIENLRENGQPDIWDWVEAKDEDYDGVRRAATLAGCGTIIRVGLSGNVHSNLDADVKEYFKPVQEALLKKKKLVYLDLKLFGRNPKDEIVHQLETGDLDFGEVPAYEAGRLANEGHEMMATAEFSAPRAEERASSSKEPEDLSHHRFVIVTNDENIHKVDEIDTSKRFACSMGYSAAGRYFPLYFLDRMRRRPPDKGLVFHQDHYGVINDLVAGKGATYGFMADYEFADLKGSCPSEQEDSYLSCESAKKIYEVDISGADNEFYLKIPNAVMVMSRKFCRRAGTDRGCAKAETFPFQYWYGFRHESTRKDQAIHNLMVAMTAKKIAGRPNAPTERFRGFESMAVSNGDRIKDVYLDSQPSLSRRLGIMLFCVLLGTGIVVRYRLKKGPRLRLSRLVPFVRDRAMSQLVARASQLSVALQEREDAWEKKFGSSDFIMQLRTSLNDSLVEVIRLYAGGTANAYECFTALASLAQIVDSTMPTLEKQMNLYRVSAGADEAETRTLGPLNDYVDLLASAIKKLI